MKALLEAPADVEYKWHGQWDAQKVYKHPDLVKYKGKLYEARLPNSAIEPADALTCWTFVGPESAINWNGKQPPEGPIQFTDEAFSRAQAAMERKVIQTFAVPAFSGPQVTGGGGGGGGEYAPERNVVRYDPTVAQDLTIREMGRHAMNEEEIVQLRRQLQEALRAGSEYRTLAQRAVDGESQAQSRLLELRKKERMELGPVAPEVRIGDTVRNRYIDHLSNMLSDGVLTQEEFGARMDKAAEAKYERELKELTADLPPMPSSDIWMETEKQPAIREPKRWLSAPLTRGNVAAVVTVMSVGAIVILLVFLLSVLF